MADINTELENLSLYKYSPSSVLNLSFERLKNMLEGDYEISSASNPFVYLLENSALNTVFAIQEYTLLTKKLYPRLANNEKDLYLHMSDYDYLGIFSEPAYADVEFNILYSDFIKYAIYDPMTSFYKFKLPRNLKLKAGNYIFTLNYPILITKSANNVINIRYDNTLENDLFPLETNYINFDVYAINSEEKYLNFKVKMPEIDIEALEVPIQKSTLVKNTINFNPSRNFYFFEAYYLDENNSWKKMIVTHTNEVYDIETPTICITVKNIDKQIDYYIPNVYINSNKIKDKIKLLVYTTNGYINVNFNDFKLSDFSVEYNKVFPEVELDDNTQPLQLITKMIFIRDRVIGGKNSLKFEEIKQKVINNFIGDRALPITDKQLEFLVEQNNFKLIKNLDIITNRIYGLELKLIKPEIDYLLSLPNFDILEFKTKLEDLSNYSNIINYTDKIKIIPYETIFEITNNGLRLLDNNEITYLQSLSNENLINFLNSKKYVSSYYHYILDASSEENELRAYELNYVSIPKINFKEVNDTIKIGINTISANIYRTPDGYRIDILCNYKKYDNSITYHNVKPYLVYSIENSHFYLEGSLYTVLNEKPVYRFYLNTNFFIDKDNKIYFTNFKDNNGLTTLINIDLNSKLNLIYTCNVIGNNYTPIPANNFIENSYIALNNAVCTYEILDVIFGYTMENLYRRYHLSTNKVEYETYDEDIPLRYEYNVYDNDNNIIHYANEIVLDENNNPVIKYRKGDVKLDENGNPILISEQKIERYLNLLVYDYKFHITNSKLLLDYKDRLRQYLLKNIHYNVESIKNKLLENTEAYVVVPKMLDTLLVKLNNKSVGYIYSNQSFIFSIFVNITTYNDSELRNNINKIILKELSNYLENNIILRKTEILDIIYLKVKEYVQTITIDKFTELNSEYLEILTTSGKISIDKLLDKTHDGYIVKENVTFNYILIE